MCQFFTTRANVIFHRPDPRLDPRPVARLDPRLEPQPDARPDP